jgi:hypothetical protein
LGIGEELKEMTVILIDEIQKKEDVEGQRRSSE